MANGINKRMITRQHDRTGGSFSRGSDRPNADVIGNAKRNYERYSTLARATALAGDSIEAENLYQHAEHYFRLMTKQVA
jgi:hypothetical protein